MAKNLNINLNLKSFSWRKLQKNISWVFLALFLLLLVFEGAEVQTSVGMVLQVNQTPQVDVPRQNKVDRIDFATYDENLRRVQGAQTYQAPGGIVYDPFSGAGAPPKPADGLPTATPLSAGASATPSSTPAALPPSPTSPSSPAAATGTPAH